MRTSILPGAVLSVLALVTIVAPPSLAAQDPAPPTDWLLGAWTIERETPRGSMTTTLTFVQDADSIVGTLSMGMARTGAANSGTGGRSMSLPIVNVTIEGAKVTFALGAPEGRPGMGGAGAGAGAARPRAGAGGGGMMSQSFSGELKGDVIEGVITTPRGEQPFTAKRVVGG